MTITIDPAFATLIPPLSDEEYAGLEASILAEGCRHALVLWKRGAHDFVLLDGHNRKRICDAHGLPYAVEEKVFDNEWLARAWMVRNQNGRRNLTMGWKIDLELMHKDFLLQAGKERMQAGGGDKKSKAAKSGLSTIDKPDLEEPHDTRQTIAAACSVSTGTIAAAEIIRKEAPETWEQVKAGETTVGAAYKKITKQKKQQEVRTKLEQIAAQKPETIEGVFDVIVIDPPWNMQKIDRDVTPNQTGFDYPTMSNAEIAQLQIPAADNCHVFLWTTHKYLPAALDILKQWGIKYVCTFVWHKPGGFQPFGLPQYNCEFVLYARKGTPTFTETKAFPLCFNAPRGAHSEKPEAFYDVIRRVTAGRRLDMFNRRKINGFIGWGQEAKP